MGRSAWRTAILKLSVVAASVLFALLALELSIRIWDWNTSRQARAALPQPAESAPATANPPASEDAAPPAASLPPSEAPTSVAPAPAMTAAWSPPPAREMDAFSPPPPAPPASASFSPPAPLEMAAPAPGPSAPPPSPFATSPPLLPASAMAVTSPPPAPPLTAVNDAPGQLTAGNWIVPDPDLIYRMPPDHPGFSRRGSQRALAGQPPEGFRVLILGDSVAYYGDGFGDTLPGMIEQNLRSNAALRPVEFLNPSIVGYTNYQELLWLKKYGLEFEPKLVGVFFVLNDVHKFLHSVDVPGGDFPSPGSPSARRAPASPFAAMAAEPEPPARQPGAVPQLSFDPHVTSGLPDIVLWAGRHSRLLQLLNRNLDIVKRTVQWYESRGYTFEYRADFYTAWQDEPWRMIDRQSAELAELGAKHGFRVFLVAVPFGDQYREDYLERDRGYVLKPQRKLAGICAAHGIAYLDLYSQLTLADFVDDRIHLDASGRRRAAAIITEFLTREGLIPPRQ